MARVQQTFGEQAARFSLYAPLAVMGISMLSAGARDEPGVKIALFVLSLLLLIGGLGLGIAALISMKHFGRKGILTRAVVGVGWNGLALTALCVLLLPLLAAGQVKRQVAGHWRLQHAGAAAHGPLDFTFNADGSFRLNGIDPKAGAISIQGTWSMNKSRQIGLQFLSINGHDAPASTKPMGLGTVRSISAGHMSLGTDSGTEEYDRVQ